jgi:hypothetical protein
VAGNGSTDVPSVTGSVNLTYSKKLIGIWFQRDEAMRLIESSN